MTLSQKDPKNSFGYFNLARGVILVMILYGHSYSVYKTATDLTVDARYMWDFGNQGLFAGAGSVLGGAFMAMMFMISGYGFFKRSPGKCFRTQRKLLLRPYWIFAAAVLLSKLLLAGIEKRSFWEHGGEYLLTFLLALNYEGGGSIRGIPVQSINIFWFVWALFIAWNCYNLILQQKNEKKQLVLVILCLLTGYALSLISRVWPFCIHIGLVCTAYLAAGSYIRKADLLEKRLTPGQWLLLGGISLISLAFGGTNMIYSYWKLGPFDILASICLGFLFLRLYSLLRDHLPENRLTAFFEKIGLLGMWVIALHAYEKMIIPWYRFGYILPGFAGVMAIFVLRMIVIWILYEILIRIRKYTRQVWGKKRK